jgi:hypothetical protein
MVEAEQEIIDRRYAALEQRFASEPMDTTAPTPEEQLVRTRLAAVQGSELKKIECRYTMCRLEIASDVVSAADLLSRLGLMEGGEVRHRKDGTFLVFAGREGFPFQEVNRPD